MLLRFNLISSLSQMNLQVSIQINTSNALSVFAILCLGLFVVDDVVDYLILCVNQSIPSVVGLGLICCWRYSIGIVFLG